MVVSGARRRPSSYSTYLRARRRPPDASRRPQTATELPNRDTGGAAAPARVSARPELVERGAQIALRRLEEAAREPDRVEVVVGAARDPGRAELVDLGARAGQQDGRVRRDDELRAGARRPGHDREQRERAADRQGGLRLVEDVQPLAAEAVGAEREERLAVRLLVQRDAAVERDVGGEEVSAIDEVRDVEEALGAQEVAGAGLCRGEDRLERGAEDRPRHDRPLSRALELPALGREADRLGDRLDQCRL